MSSTRSSRSRDNHSSSSSSNSSSSSAISEERQSSRRRLTQNNEEESNATDLNITENNRSSLSQYKPNDLSSDKVYITYPMKLSSKDIANWNKQSKDVQQLCIKRIVRFILFRSSKREPITHDKIGDILAILDSSYKKLATPCIYYVQEILKKDFGYNLTEHNDIIGIKANPATKNYYLINDLQSAELHKIIAKANHDPSFTGFCYVVFVAIFTSINNATNVEDLLKCVRLADPRFPATLIDRKGKSQATTDVAIPELKQDFTGLLSRMKKVRIK